MDNQNNIVGIDLSSEKAQHDILKDNWTSYASTDDKQTKEILKYVSRHAKEFPSSEDMIKSQIN